MAKALKMIKFKKQKNYLKVGLSWSQVWIQFISLFISNSPISELVNNKKF